MESYLSGRDKAQHFKAKITPKKNMGLDSLKPAEEEEEQIVHAEPVESFDAEAAGAPEVDLVVKGKAVRKIIIHMPEGQRLELDCVYEGEEEDE